MSREKLGFIAGVSASYVTQLERGSRFNPTPEIVEALTRSLDRVAPLASAARRHLYDLAGITHVETLPAAADLAADLRDSGLASPGSYNSSPAAYIDIRGSLLAHNDSFARSFQGVTEQGNVLRWMFADPMAQRALIEWEREVASTAAMMRGWLGEISNPSIAQQVLSELDRYPAFRRAWAHGEVEYAQDRPLMVRHLETGAVAALDWNVFRVDTNRYPNLARFMLGVGWPERAPVPTCESCQSGRPQLV